MIEEQKEKWVKIIAPHRSNYPDPIRVSEGQKVRVGERYMGNENWDNWIYCYTEEPKREGWVPEQILDIHSHSATILEDYIARELNVEVNERVFPLRELNGWLWVKTFSTDEVGWIPKSITKPLENFDK